MKMSFSLSSLQPSSNGLESSEQTRSRTERPYNSLTKKRKDPKQEYCQRILTNREDCKDDFWAAIRSNYDYIMDTNLIDSCKEASGELAWDETDVSTQPWGLKEVSCQFSELYTWLRVLQELVYSKEENLLDKSLRAAHMEELRRKAYRRRLFNEQAGKLVSRAPSLKDEVAWRMDHLNAKWELVEQMMAPIIRPVSDKQDVTADFEHEVKCLRKWLREMESRLQPLSFHINWTRAELEEKATEHMILQRDIEAHGRIVSSVVKLSERVTASEKERQAKDDENEVHEEELEEENQRNNRKPVTPLRIASSLERRWHLLFLRALEWQCHIEALATRICNKIVPNASRCSSDSDDEEPVTKQPRLSRRQSRDSGARRNSSSSGSARSKRLKKIPRSWVKGDQRHHHQSDSDCVSSENRFTDDGSYFEDELCQLCVMDTKLEKFEDNEVTKTSRLLTGLGGDQGEEGDVEEEEEMPPTPETVPIGCSSTSTKTMNRSCDEIDGNSTTLTENNSTQVNNMNRTDIKNSPKRRKTVEETSASFNSSDRKSKNCATFYFKHLDTDSEADCQNDETQIGVDESSEEEWIFTSSPSGKYAFSDEKRKTNVVVRLDFGENETTQNYEKAETMDLPKSISNSPVKNNVNGMKNANGNVVEENTNSNDDSNFNKVKDSDDESKGDKNSIQKLIREVEKLVREEGNKPGNHRKVSPFIFEDKNGGLNTSNRAKYARIKEWLKLNSTRNIHEGKSTSQYWLQPMDSCDASGEYTTEDSDDGEKQSVSSDDLQSSVATYRRFEGGLLGCASQSVSQEIIEDNIEEGHTTQDYSQSTPKVVMRSKRKTNSDTRPWSVSCISQIVKQSSLIDDTNNFSISETALHQLVTAPPTKSVSLDATGSSVPFNNSASTLLEETIIGKDGRVVRNSSLRRRKNRLRKKNLNRKSESSHHSAGSDGSTNNHNNHHQKTSSSSSARKSGRSLRASVSLVKSGSFSGCTAHQKILSNERTIVSDPSPQFRLTCCNSITSTSETEDEQRIYVIRNGCNDFQDNLLDTVLKNKELCKRQSSNNFDSDVEMNSLGNNSFSEQAWDNYQEKYMSEPYSEAADVETARRLLDFGDDYRNFLDSQSDCASSCMSAVRGTSPLPSPRNRIHHSISGIVEDSDSEMEEWHKVMENSHNQLMNSESVLMRPNGALGTIIAEDYAEFKATCRENLKCLNGLLVCPGDSPMRKEKFIKQIRGLIERWESLQLRAEEAERVGALHREITSMHLEFKAAQERLLSHQVALEQSHVLDERINQINNELATLRERKPAMLTLNVSTHRLITDIGASSSMSPIFTALKDGVAELYRLWDETFQKGNQQLCALQALQQFSIRLTELQLALRRDKDTLAVLDAALKAGATSEVASSVRDVARLLSEKQDVVTGPTGSVMNICTTETEIVVTSDTSNFGDKNGDASNLTTQEGGSLSDSGISDSGSEQELSEREKRLAALRRLTRSLETQFEPGSDALIQLWKRVEDAEIELRSLQRQCRELIVRTAASVESRSANYSPNPLGSSIGKRRKLKQTIDTESSGSSKIMKTAVTDAGDPDSEPDLPDSWIWRILRAALPFQLAIVALFCAACLLEPHCCEAANTLNLSLTPQLRYVRGPPPV